MFSSSRKRGVLTQIRAYSEQVVPYSTWYQIVADDKTSPWSPHLHPGDYYFLKYCPRTVGDSKFSHLGSPEPRQRSCLQAPGASQKHIVHGIKLQLTARRVRRALICIQEVIIYLNIALVLPAILNLVISANLNPVNVRVRRHLVLHEKYIVHGTKLQLTTRRVRGALICIQGVIIYRNIALVLTAILNLIISANLNPVNVRVRRHPVLHKNTSYMVPNCS